MSILVPKFLFGLRSPRLGIAVLSVGCIVAAQPASAQVALNPGTVLPAATPGFLVDDYPGYGGSAPLHQQTVLFNPSSPFYAPGEFHGGVLSQVSNDDPLNPGKLTFFYQFSNHSDNFITQFTVSGFAGWDISVGWDGPPGNPRWSGLAPDSVSRTADGNWVNLNFAPGVVDPSTGEPGNLYVYTDIPGGVLTSPHNLAFLSEAGTALNDHVDIFAPSPVPEPLTSLTWLAGLAAIGGALRRRTAASR